MQLKNKTFLALNHIKYDEMQSFSALKLALIFFKTLRSRSRSKRFEHHRSILRSFKDSGKLSIYLYKFIQRFIVIRQAFMDNIFRVFKKLIIIPKNEVILLQFKEIFSSKVDKNGSILSAKMSANLRSRSVLTNKNLSAAQT